MEIRPYGLFAEPDVKNGVGGFAGLQNILWMAHVKFGYESFREIQKAKMLRQDERISMERAYDFLLRVRELHSYKTNV